MSAVLRLFFSSVNRHHLERFIFSQRKDANERENTGLISLEKAQKTQSGFTVTDIGKLFSELWKSNGHKKHEKPQKPTSYF
jgi:hypothetical protein